MSGESDDRPEVLLPVKGAFRLPKRAFHHVYFLLRDGVLVYVGQTSNIRQRLGVHKTAHDEVWVLPVADDLEARALERYWAKMLQPVTNVRLKKREWTLEEAIGANIKLARERLGMDQQDLALAVKRGVNRVRGWESGSRWVPDIVELQRLSNVLGVSIDSLFRKPLLPDAKPEPAETRL